MFIGSPKRQRLEQNLEARTDGTYSNTEENSSDLVSAGKWGLQVSRVTRVAGRRIWGLYRILDVVLKWLSWQVGVRFPWRPSGQL
jgi:hypothetical protein